MKFAPSESQPFGFGQMNTSDVSSVLAQIRALSPQLRDATPIEPAAAPGGFSATLRNAIDSVNQVQQEAGAKSAAFAAGDPDVEIAEVMLALNQSKVSFKALSEVRNRMVSAYQDIMNMPI